MIQTSSVLLLSVLVLHSLDRSSNILQILTCGLNWIPEDINNIFGCTFACAVSTEVHVWLSTGNWYSWGLFRQVKKKFDDLDTKIFSLCLYV